MLNDGYVQCWGRNQDGQLGVGTNQNVLGYSSAVSAADAGVVTLPDNGTASAVVAGGFHTCALLTSGALLCWGDNGAGELGTATTTDLGGSGEPTPGGNPGIAPLSFGGPTAFKVSLGLNDTCALLSDGNVRCLGR